MSREKKQESKLSEMNRRQFMKTAGATGLAALSSSSLLGLGSLMPAHAAVAGATAAERAVNAAIALKKKMKGDTLTIMIPSGGEGSALASKPWWEEATGIKIKVIVTPMLKVIEKAMNAAVTRTTKFDVTIVPASTVADLVEAKFSQDLTDYVQKYDPELTGPNGVIEPLYLFGMYKGRLYGLNTDGDVNSLFIRRDWLNDPETQKAFEDKYGYPLQPPVLYKEYFDQAKFFTNPDKGTYGAWIYASPGHAKYGFLQFFYPKGVLPFDDDMNPQIAGPEGVEALEEMLSIKDCLHPGCFSGGWDYAYKGYSEGKIWSMFAWPSYVKYGNFPEHSNIVGQHMLCQVPGNKMADGTILRPCRFTFGWMYLVSRYSKNKELAYLYSQWMYSPSISARIMPIKGSYFDPFRYSHLKDEELMKTIEPKYWKEIAKPMMLNVENCYPEISIKGGEEYTTRLDENVIAAWQGLKKPEQALKDTADEWQKITERYGRDTQKENWRFWTSTLGANLRRAMNLPDPPAWVKEMA